MSQMPPNPPASPPAGGQPGPELVTAPPEQGTSTRTKILVGAGALAAVAAVGYLVLGGDDDVDPNSPVGVVQRLYDAMERQDCTAAIDLLSDDLLTSGANETRNDTLAECEADAAEDEAVAMEGVDLDFSLESESGDNAVVEVKASFMGDTMTSSVDVVRVDGQWKVDSLARGSGGSDAGDAEEPGS